MKSTSGPSSLTLPPALLAELQAEADEERRPALAVLEDAVQTYLREARAKREIQRARDAGLPDDAVPPTDAHRRDLREKIAAGVRSLREGKGTDGDGFMAGLDAKLAELERQGR